MLRDSLARPPKPIARLSAYPGESLLGFLSRSIASTSISDFLSVARLCGERLRIERFNCEVPSESISAFIGSTSDELSNLLDRRFVFPPSDLTQLQQTTFRRQNSLATRKIRRVSPAALRASNFHRRHWDTPAVSFDLETLTSFLDHCPECGQTLGWRRAVEANHCDHCLMDNGMPSVDLRKMPIIAVVDEVSPGLQFASDLAGSWRLDSSRRLPEQTALEWRTAAPETLLEILIAIARTTVQPSQKDVDAEAISAAGLIMLGGQDRLSEHLEIGLSLHNIWLGQDAARLLEIARRRAGKTKTSHSRPPSPTHRAEPLARRADIAFRIFERAPVDYAKKSLPKVRSLLPAAVWDAQDIDRVSDVLAVTPCDIAKLIRWGLIDLCEPSVLDNLPHRRFISSASLQRLMEGIRLHAISADACTLQWTKFISIADFKENHPSICWAELIAALRTGRVSVFNLHSSKPCWSSQLNVFAANNLKSVVREATRELHLLRRKGLQYSQPKLANR